MTQNVTMVNTLDAGAVVDRMKEVSGASSDEALAHSLGTGRSTVTNWRARNSLPLMAVLEFAARHALSIDWLIKGEGEPRRNDPPFASTLIVPDLFGLALEEAAHAFVAEHPGRELTVSKLVKPALRHYDKYCLLCRDLSPSADELIASLNRSVTPVCSWGFLGYYPTQRK